MTVQTDCGSVSLRATVDTAGRVSVLSHSAGEANPHTAVHYAEEFRTAGIVPAGRYWIPCGDAEIMVDVS